MSTEELHALAMENTPTLLPLSVQFTPALLADPMDHPMLVITNQKMLINITRFVENE